MIDSNEGSVKSQGISIAEVVYDLSSKKGGLVLPDGITGKFITAFENNKPYRNVLIFSDGSELIDQGGLLFWSECCEWEPEVISPPKINT